MRQPERMDHHLACYQQTMKDGRVRQRNLLPSEKVYAGEDLTKAVRRCIHEELGSQLDPADPTGTAPSPRTSLGLALVKAPKTSIALVEGCFVVSRAPPTAAVAGLGDQNASWRGGICWRLHRNGKRLSSHRRTRA